MSVTIYFWQPTATVLNVVVISVHLLKLIVGKTLKCTLEDIAKSSPHVYDMFGLTQRAVTYSLWVNA
jgi:hypothetical protein